MHSQKEKENSESRKLVALSSAQVVKNARGEIFRPDSKETKRLNTLRPPSQNHSRPRQNNNTVQSNFNGQNEEQKAAFSNRQSPTLS